MQGAWQKGSAIALIAALAQVWLAGAVIAAHLVHHDHDALRHHQSAVVELLLHGHDHEPGTPEHEHPVVAARSTPQHLKRSVLPGPSHAASPAELSSAPRRPHSFRREPELHGPSPPSRSHAFVVLRI